MQLPTKTLLLLLPLLLRTLAAHIRGFTNVLAERKTHSKSPLVLLRHTSFSTGSGIESRQGGHSISQLGGAGGRSAVGDPNTIPDLDNPERKQTAQSSSFAHLGVTGVGEPEAGEKPIPDPDDLPERGQTTHGATPAHLGMTNGEVGVGKSD